MPIVQWQAGATQHTEAIDSVTTCDAVVPLSAARRIKETTNLLLVYERAEDRKANGESAPKKVWQMPPKGWGDTSYEEVSASMSFDVAEFERPVFLREPDEPGPSANKGEMPYKLLTTLIGGILSGQTLDPNLIGNNKPLMAVWLACQDDAETPDQAFAVFILALEMLLHTNLAATSGKSIPTSQLNKVRKYGDVKSEAAVVARYQDLKAAFPAVTLNYWKV